MRTRYQFFYGKDHKTSNKSYYTQKGAYRAMLKKAKKARLMIDKGLKVGADIDYYMGIIDSTFPIQAQEYIYMNGSWVFYENVGKEIGYRG